MLRRLWALWQRRNTPRVIDDGVAPDDTACCPRCLTPLDRFDHACPACATPITAHATIDPLGQVYAWGHLYRQIADGRPRAVTLIGAWLLWWPALLLPIVLVLLPVRWWRGKYKLVPERETAYTISTEFGDIEGYAVLATGVTAAEGTAWIVALLTAACELVLLCRVTKHYIQTRRGPRPGMEDAE